MLQQLVSEQMYVVDEKLVAEAIMMRGSARMFVPDAAFRNEPQSVPQVRSFRLEHEARSFRLTGLPRRRQLVHS